MSEGKLSKAKLSRRSLFRAGAIGFCSLCLAGVSGCAPENNNKESHPADYPAGTTRKGFIRKVRSPWYTELDNNRVLCTLCPEECQLSQGERGPCRVRENLDGACYSLAYGNPALVQEDPVERKPFFHVLPGSRALSISTAGCNLACKFCEVWEMALADPEEVYAYDMPPDTVIKQALKSDVHSLSYAFGEPVVYYEYMAETAKMARNEGFLNLIHTAAHIQREPLKELLKEADAVNVDLKSFDNEFYREYVGGELEVVLENLKIIREAGVHLEITSIVIPTLNDDIEKIGEMCRWIRSELGEDIPLHFARFYPLYRLSSLPRTPVSTLEAARNKAMELGLKYVYIAKVTGHDGENTFCPECGKKVIERMGFVIENLKLEEGACAYCGTSIPGIWT